MSERKLTEHPQRGMFVFTTNFCCTYGCKLGSGYGVPICTPAEKGGEKEDVGVCLWPNMEEAEIIEVDRDVRARGQR